MKKDNLFRHKPISRFHAMAKPTGPICNLDCHYCYYLSKEGLLHSETKWHMTPETLEEYIKQYIQSQNTPEIVFSWQGGEPTLLGVGFFREIIRLQKKYCPKDKVVQNDLQTNGTNLNDEWYRFLKENNFLVGLSIDGPKELHDMHRLTKGGAGTFDKVFAAAKALKEHGILFNTLTCVNRDTAQEPLKVYRFLRDEIGPNMMQFIPIVEPKEFYTTAPQYWDESDMPLYKSANAYPGSENSVVTPWSVDPRDFGKFLNTVFDEWYLNDLGRVFVHYFEMMVNIWSGNRAIACTHSPMCGKGVAIEHDGTVYSCDHYVYPEFALGNIKDQTIGQMVFSKHQETFGRAKEGTLTTKCRECEWQFACYGECPKNRFLQTENGELGHNYLCEGWEMFYAHINKRMKHIVSQLGLDQ